MSNCSHVEPKCECGFEIDVSRDYFSIKHNNFSAFPPSKNPSHEFPLRSRLGHPEMGDSSINWATPLPIDNRLDNVHVEDGNVNSQAGRIIQGAILLVHNVSLPSVASQRRHIARQLQN